jgi:hypothetical protein
LHCRIEGGALFLTKTSSGWDGGQHSALSYNLARGEIKGAAVDFEPKFSDNYQHDNNR